MSTSRANDPVAFDRAFALMDRIDERTAERLEPTPYGPVVVDTRLARVHDLNFLRAEEPGNATAAELAAEAERVQAAAGIGHRRVNIRNEEQRERLEPQFAALGWEPERFVLMVQRREPDRPADHEVREVDEQALRPLWAEAIRHEPHGKDERLVRQILEHRRRISEAIPTRLFAAEADGKLVAHTELTPRTASGRSRTSSRCRTTGTGAWHVRSSFARSASRTRSATTSPSSSRTPTTGRSGSTRSSASKRPGVTPGS